MPAPPYRRDKLSLFGRSALAGAVAWSRFETLATRMLAIPSHLLSGFLQAALTSDEKTALTVALYERSSRRDRPRGEIFAWEREWFQSDLPPPPATILLGAAGRGRELGWLLERGYGVDAFEPSPSGAAACRRLIKGRGEAFVGTYQDLARAVLDRDGGLEALASRRYDAAILGYGSLTHIIDPRDHRRILEAMDILCPRGPLLASFWFDDEPRARGRLERLGFALGAQVAQGRHTALGLPSDFKAWCGFAHFFTLAELEALARHCGRRMSFSPERCFPYPRMTLTPQGTSP